jgi:hypothetical protein
VSGDFSRGQKQVVPNTRWLPEPLRNEVAMDYYDPVKGSVDFSFLVDPDAGFSGWSTWFHWHQGITYQYREQQRGVNKFHQKLFVREYVFRNPTGTSYEVAVRDKGFPLADEVLDNGDLDLAVMEIENQHAQFIVYH